MFSEYRPAHYRLNAIGFGRGYSLGFSALGPIKMGGWNAGVDTLYLSNSRSVASYGYYGATTNGLKAGLDKSRYLIIGINIDHVDDYSGFNRSASLTLAEGGGVTVSYFWNPENEVLQPDAPQGVTIGLVQGEEISGALSTMHYLPPWICINC